MPGSVAKSHVEDISVSLTQSWCFAARCLPPFIKGGTEGEFPWCGAGPTFGGCQPFLPSGASEETRALFRNRYFLVVVVDLFHDRP